MRSSVGCLCSAGISLCCAHTGATAASGITVVGAASFSRGTLKTTGNGGVRLEPRRAIASSDIEWKTPRTYFG